MTLETQKETRGFESEVKQLLDLVINSLYSNREIFLRELISNASDAIGKLRFAALSDDSLYESESDMLITLDYSNEHNTITVCDNGIGLSRDEAVENLGTIARSGTKEFFGSLTGDQRKDSELIGQFGVGFYAAFIVADRVVVTSRKAGLAKTEGVRWESIGDGEFSIETVERAKRGTEVILHLKDDAKEFANGFQLRELCKRYSDHISIPIQMPKEGEDEEGVETINAATALWLRNKSDISDEEYQEFYKGLSYDFTEPMSWVHSHVEGKHEYTSLFYIPGAAPFDLWDNERNRGIKLYVQRIFIMEESEQILPRYLRFVRGVIDTNDLPLNVSRELLQRNKVIDAIRAGSIKKVLGAIERIAKSDDYAKFWSEFGRVLKEGVIEDFDNRDRVAKLLRFSSTRDSLPDADVSLEEYISRKKEDQENIYFIVADGFGAAKNSPHLEAFRKADIEVLLLHEPVDEWLVSHLTEFEGMALKSAAHGDLQELGSEQEEQTNDAEDDKLVERIKNALENMVADVRVSRRLTDSPACLVSGDNQMSANLERILKATGQEVPDSKRTLEVNREHPMLQCMDHFQDEDEFATWASLLFEQSVLAEGGRLEDPAGFVKRMNDALLKMASG
ncbi:MAG: molecular chaperone HtpG [Pseudomonadota bacterium]